MKIGILTYHSVFNFGANLQVLSTLGYLKNNGYEPVVINWITRDLEAGYDMMIPAVQADAHKKFIHNYLTCTDVCRDESDIARVIETQNIKGIIIGSDALWQHSTLYSRIHLNKKGITITRKPGTTGLFPNPFWGSFIPLLKERIPVVIMSVSCQNTSFKSIIGNTKKRMSISLKQFQAVTVRDHWTQKMVSYLTSGSILPSITPDPVFAFNQNIPEQILKKQLVEKYYLNDRYLLVSIRSGKNSRPLLTKIIFNVWLLLCPKGLLSSTPFQEQLNHL